MGLGLSLGLRVYQKCSLCDGTTDEHNAGCPFAQLQVLEDSRPAITCPKCNKGSVEINTGDYYECRECATQFTRAEQGIEEEVIFVDWKHDTTLRVAVLPDKGRGEFKIDRDLARVQKIIDEGKNGISNNG